MSEIEKLALALVNQVERERATDLREDKIERIMRGLVLDEALCRAIEQREALRVENERLAAQVEQLLNLLEDCNPESMSWLDARDAALEAGGRITA